MRALFLVVLLLPSTAWADPAEQVVPAGRTTLVLSEPHLLISLETGREAAAAKRRVAQLEEELVDCAEERAREVQPDRGWSAWRWSAVGAAVALAFVGGLALGAR